MHLCVTGISRKQQIHHFFMDVQCTEDHTQTYTFLSAVDFNLFSMYVCTQKFYRNRVGISYESVYFNLLYVLRAFLIGNSVSHFLGKLTSWVKLYQTLTQNSSVRKDLVEKPFFFTTKLKPALAGFSGFLDFLGKTVTKKSCQPQQMVFVFFS